MPGPLFRYRQVSLYLLYHSPILMQQFTFLSVVVTVTVWFLQSKLIKHPKEFDLDYTVCMCSRFVHFLTVYFVWSDATCTVWRKSVKFHLARIKTTRIYSSCRMSVKFSEPVNIWSDLCMHVLWHLFTFWSQNVRFHRFTYMLMGEACNNVQNSSRVLTTVCSSCSSHIGNSRALSFSAPSAINLDFSQVKFEEETHDWTEESLLNKSTADHRWLLVSRMCMLFVMLHFEIFNGCMKFLMGVREWMCL